MNVFKKKEKKKEEEVFENLIIRYFLIVELTIIIVLLIIRYHKVIKKKKGILHITRGSVRTSIIRLIFRDNLLIRVTDIRCIFPNTVPLLFEHY